MERLKRSPVKPVRAITSRHVAELADSLRRVGVLQPILVRELDNGELELLAGDHRVQAAREAGLAEVPAMVWRGDNAAAEQASIETDLRMYAPAPQDRQRLVARWLELQEAQRGQRKPGRPPQSVSPRDSFAEEAGALIHKSRATVYRDVLRARLDPVVLEAIKDGRLKPSQGDELTRLAHAEQRAAVPELTGKTRGETRVVVRRLLAAGAGHARASDADPPQHTQNSRARVLKAALQSTRSLRDVVVSRLADVSARVAAATEHIDTREPASTSSMLLEIRSTVTEMGTALNSLFASLEDRLTKLSSVQIAPDLPTGESESTTTGAGT